jgi:putative flippase GtrA
MKRFSFYTIAGGIGFLIDYSVFLWLNSYANYHLARIMAFCVAVVATFFINSHLTFRDHRGSFRLYLLGQLKGIGVNMAVYEIIIFFGGAVMKSEAFFAGSATAFLFNFTYAKYLVFKNNTEFI